MRCGHSMIAGSSPHPWGTRWHDQRRRLGLRFIPTPVGNTSAIHCTMPRQDGSSPHPWGTRPSAEARSTAVRFIPTPVGNTMMAWLVNPSDAVHPHTRGEHAFRMSAGISLAGSSPHPWGTPGGERRRVHGQRFIPTPVGNTPRNRDGEHSAAVHPHTRGEHVLPSVMTLTLAGSSPHPWGTRGIGFRIPRCSRFIPTPVGNTFSSQ